MIFINKKNLIFFLIYTIHFEHKSQYQLRTYNYFLKNKNFTT